MSSELFGGMGPDQFGFMAESEGQDDLVDTREAKINAISREIKELRLHLGVDVADHIKGIIEKRGIDIDSLTPGERAKIDWHF